MITSTRQKLKIIMIHHNDTAVENDNVSVIGLQSQNGNEAENEPVENVQPVEPTENTANAYQNTPAEQERDTPVVEQHTPLDLNQTTRSRRRQIIKAKLGQVNRVKQSNSSRDTPIETDAGNQDQASSDGWNWLDRWMEERYWDIRESVKHRGGVGRWPLGGESDGGAGRRAQRRNDPRELEDARGAEKASSI
ncbi:hypothetical protein Cni_G10151 [Canna indica]|uniref:Uncharacterized protein n=1 Tax=Canna indica TaxID=4628 RepID=A0AAQ3K3U2_9LILI|nr:hypothetical protein Cni_G10151 [Canna indica]